MITTLEGDIEYVNAEVTKFAIEFGYKYADLENEDFGHIDMENAHTMSARDIEIALARELHITDGADLINIQFN